MRRNLALDREGKSSASRKKVPCGRSFSGIHYGKTITEVLQRDRYGSGIRGAAANPLRDVTDPRIRRRVYFCIDPDLSPMANYMAERMASASGLKKIDCEKFPTRITILRYVLLNLRNFGETAMRWLIIPALFVPLGVLADTITIATWNLGGFHQIPQHKLDKIIEGMGLLDADIIVVPEINPISHGQAIADKLSEPADKCYEANVPDSPRANQDIGFIHKCGIDVTDVGMIAGSDLFKQGYRNAATARIKADKFDFILVGLHLKASRGPTNRALRNEQLGWISGFVQGVQMGTEKDVLVIGDYNMIPGQDGENFERLNADGLMRVVSSEDLADQGTHVHSDGMGSLLDGYAFTNVDVAEYQEGSIAIIQMHTELGMTLEEFRTEVTDHLPVVALFEAGTDND